MGCKKPSAGLCYGVELHKEERSHVFKVWSWSGDTSGFICLCRLRFCGHNLFLHERSALCGWVSLIPLSFYLEQHCPNHMIFHFLSIRWKGFSLAVGENRRNVQFLKEWKYVCTWNAWHNTRLFKKILMRSFSKYISARVNFTADRYLGIKIEWILGGGLFCPMHTMWILHLCFLI